jgi:hypothetical protein
MHRTLIILFNLSKGNPFITAISKGTTYGIIHASNLYVFDYAKQAPPPLTISLKMT